MRPAHQQMRDAALDAAAEDVLRGGWPALQMRAIATRIGVSRQTLYNTFTSKHGLAEALILRHTAWFLDGIEAAIAAETTLHDQWAAAVRFTLDTAADDALVKTVLVGEASPEFLPLLTSESAPVITAARDRLVAAIRPAHPELDAGALADAAETVTRLALSHLVLSTRPADQVAEHVATLATRYLTA